MTNLGVVAGLTLQVEYFMYRNSACAGDPLTISQGPAELAALYTCEKTDDSKFGLRYGGYGAYLYGACVDGQVVLEIHAEAGCHDAIANYVYPSQVTVVASPKDVP